MDRVIALDYRLINLMEQAEDRNVDIYWLDDNFGNVLKAHIYIGNQFICEAVEKSRYNKARIEQTNEDIQNRELMSKYVATIEGFGRSQRKQLDNVVVIGERPITISNSFQIPGRRKTVMDNEKAPELADINDDETKDLIVNETSFKRYFKHKF